MGWFDWVWGSTKEEISEEAKVVAPEVGKIEEEVKELEYSDYRANVLSGIEMLMYNADLVTSIASSEESWFGSYKKIVEAMVSAPWQVKMIYDLSYLKSGIEKDTGESIMTLLTTNKGLVKLFSSKTFGAFLADAEVWKKLDAKKVVEILKRYPVVYRAYGIKEKQLEQFVPSLLKLLQALSTNLSEHKTDVAAFIAGHQEMNIDEQFFRDGIDFSKVAQMASLVQENGHLKKDFMVVVTTVLPYISTLLQDKAKIYIPQASRTGMLHALESVVPTLVGDIAGEIPGMFNPDLQVQSKAMRNIVEKVLKADLSEVEKSFAPGLLTQYLKDVSNSLETVKDKSVGGMVYVESYVKDEETRKKVAVMLKRLLPRIKELAPEILKLYDYSMLTTPAQKEDTQKMLEGGFAIAKELTKEELEMVVRIEVERYMAYPTSKSVNDLFPQSLRSELMPFVSELVHDAIQKDKQPLAAGYLTKFFHGEILASDFTFDLIDLFMDGLNKKEVADKYFGFFKNTENKENLESALKRMLVNNPQLKGKEKQIVGILSDPKKVGDLAEMYKAFRNGHYGKLTMQALGAIVLPWKDSDIRGTIVFIAFNYIRSFVIENVYPAFIRNKIYGKFANEVVDVISGMEEGAEPVKLKDHLQSKVTVDSHLSFRKEHFIATGSFRGLDINTKELKNISFEGLNLSDCVFGARKISYSSFVNTNLAGAKFKKVTEIDGVMFDVKSATEMLHGLSKRNNVKINLCEVKLESGESIWINDNKIIVSDKTVLTPKEFEMLSTALQKSNLVTIDEESRKKLVVETKDKSKPLTADDIASLKSAEKQGIIRGEIAQAMLDQLDSRTQGKSISVA